MESPKRALAHVQEWREVHLRSFPLMSASSKVCGVNDMRGGNYLRVLGRPDERGNTSRLHHVARGRGSRSQVVFPAPRGPSSRNERAGEQLACKHGQHNDGKCAGKL